MKTKYIFFIFFIFQFFFLYANPFTGKKNSPSPVYQSRPSENILKYQRVLNQKLGDYIADWKENQSLSILIPILGLSFLYGLVHAAGPGHRKSIVFSFYLTRKQISLNLFLQVSALPECMEALHWS